MTYDILTNGHVATRASDLAPPSADDVTVGKDLLELLSAGMYVDPMSIYREYVQNAADAIDQARNEGLIGAEEPGRIDIALTPQGRGIRIRDNGAGLKRDDFVRTLLAVGGSRKRGSSFRGFRGVGRLAGLAYAQELVFRSRAAGEGDVSELRWDTRRLKAALRDRAFEGGIDRLILHCAETRAVAGDDYPDRFFEVELKGVIRLRADRLMTPSAVEQFLAQQAPVPFSPDFRHGPEIAAALRASGVPLPVHIHLDGSDTPLYRPHRNHFHVGNGHEAGFTELEVREVPDMDGGPAALAWVLHHDYVGAIPSANLIKGLRMRVADLQVGGAHVLEECFAEPRFNSWSVGEVHVLDRRITPNARRDDFEQNVHHNNLLNHLSPLFREISKRCRGNSIRRNWVRKLDLSLAKARKATLAPASHHDLASAREALAEASRIAAMPLLWEEDLASRRAEIDAIVATVDQLQAAPLEADPLASFTADQRSGAERILELITACSDDRQAASALIARIMQRLGGELVSPQATGMTSEP